MEKPDDIKQEIENVVDEYQMSHKGNAQCKCISGARGHLIAKLMTLADRIREDERERIRQILHKYFPSTWLFIALDEDAKIETRWRKDGVQIYSDLINSLTTK